MLKYTHINIIILPEYVISQVNRGLHDNFAIVHNKAIISMVGHA